MLKRLVLVASFALCFMLISAQIIGFAEVRDLKDSAVAAWSFEGNFKDMTDNGNDGKKLGETTFVAGKFGKAISLSGKGDGVITPKLAPMNEVTVAHWSKCTGRIGAWRVWINVDGWQKGAVHHQLYPDNRIGWSIHTNTPTDVQAKLLIDDKQKGKWNHIAVVYSAPQKNVKFYINGVLESEGKYTAVGPAILGPARIGSWDGGGRDYEGAIDEFVIFDSILEEKDVQTLIDKGLDEIWSVEPGNKVTTIWGSIRSRN
jgi:hypothetical protein